MRNKLKNIFIWLSNSDPKVLENSGVDIQRKYIKLGAAILVPAIIAWIGGYFAAPYLGLDNGLEFIAATIWSCIILIIDLALVSSLDLPKEWNYSNAFSYWGKAIIRLIIAVVLGIMISHPFVLRIFKESIEEQMIIMRGNKVDDIRSAGRDTLKIINLNLTRQTDSLTALNECLIKLRTYEQNGMVRELPCGTSGKHDGEGYRTIFLDNRRIEIEKQIDSLKYRIEINNIEQGILTQLSIDSLITNYSFDYLKRVDALNELIQEEKIQKSGKSHTQTVSLIVIISLILLDIMAVLTKLLIDRDEYNELLIIAREKRKVAMNEYYSNETELHVAISRAETDKKNQMLTNMINVANDNNYYQTIGKIRNIMSVSIKSIFNNPHENGYSTNQGKAFTFKDAIIMILNIVGISMLICLTGVAVEIIALNEHPQYSSYFTVVVSTVAAAIQGIFIHNKIQFNGTRAN